MTSLYYVANSRSAEQTADMEQLEARGTCLFCAEHLDFDQEQIVLHRTARWTVTQNEFPYRGTKYHLLLVPNEHEVDVLDLPYETQIDIWEALAWAKREYALDFWSWAGRNGDCACTGGTIRHVHIHVVVGNVDDPDHIPVRFKMSSARRA
jgi:ATP adenylyltransferase